MMFSLFFLYSMYFFVFGLIFFCCGIFFNLYSYSLFLDYEFFSFNSIIVSMSMYFDDISLLFMGCVLIISSMVVFYSYSYMSSDIFSYRFLYMVVLFVMSMMMLIISPNLLSILLGWDGLGLISYCLVVYFNNFKSYNAGMLTVLTNRLGDVAILISLGLLINWGSFHFIYISGGFLSDWLLSIMIVVASFTKSAQIPFSSWLPAAMAAPTPVSALVHSSTLVTAGVYLLIRFEFVMKVLDLKVFLALSCLTMIMAGVGALLEFDLKKIIALSTLSQLGLMMMILLLGEPLVSFFHLLNHAFFKSLLFLCAGLIIHCISDSQDIRYLSCSLSYLPVTCSCFCISSLSLCGLPYLTGFYSKHSMLNYALGGDSSFMIGLVFYVSLMTTIMYSVRLVYYCFSGHTAVFSVNNYMEDNIMILSMMFLCLMSIFGGSMLGWILLIDFGMIPIMDHSLMVNLLMLMSCLSGYYFSCYSYNSADLSIMKSFLGGMWFLPSFSSYFLYYVMVNCSNKSDKYYGMGWSEYISSGKLISLIKLSSLVEKLLYNNNIKLMLALFLIMFIFMVSF
uniref:NADH-ubiquinone oxidoreductase chain 5 n=1 Tax=Mezira sp. TaxID=2931906 RepID=A0A8T9W3H3_9HEMI|nr:NADH dehydrogenase subunit 5 [Mezira sp.]